MQYGVIACGAIGSSCCKMCVFRRLETERIDKAVAVVVSKIDYLAVGDFPIGSVSRTSPSARSRLVF